MGPLFVSSTSPSLLQCKILVTPHMPTRDSLQKCPLGRRSWVWNPSVRGPQRRERPPSLILGGDRVVGRCMESCGEKSPWSGGSECAQLGGEPVLSSPLVSDRILGPYKYIDRIFSDSRPNPSIAFSCQDAITKMTRWIPCVSCRIAIKAVRAVI